MTNENYDKTKVEIEQVTRVQADTFRCPSNLQQLFIAGALGDEQYTKTFLRIYACDDTSSEVTCMEKTQRDQLIASLRVQFIYLETNFEGKNIDNPLVGFL